MSFHKVIYRESTCGIYDLSSNFECGEMNNFNARDSADYFGIQEEDAAGKWIVL